MDLSLQFHSSYSGFIGCQLGYNLLFASAFMMHSWPQLTYNTQHCLLTWLWRPVRGESNMWNWQANNNSQNTSLYVINLTSFVLETILIDPVPYSASLALQAYLCPTFCGVIILYYLFKYVNWGFEIDEKLYSEDSFSDLMSMHHVSICTWVLFCIK